MNGLATQGTTPLLQYIQSPSSVCVCIERGASQNAAYIIERGDLKAKDRGFAIVLCIAAWRLAVCLAPS